MVRLTDRPDMILDVTVDVKQQHNNNMSFDIKFIRLNLKHVGLAQW